MTVSQRGWPINTLHSRRNFPAPARLHRVVEVKLILSFKLTVVLPVMPERKEFWTASLLFGGVEYHAMQSRGSEGTLIITFPRYRAGV